MLTNKQTKKKYFVSWHYYRRAVTDLQIQILAWLVFLHYVHQQTNSHFQGWNHSDEGSYSKATWRGHLRSTGCQACKLLKGKKQVSAFATGTIYVTYCRIPVPSEDTTACLHHRFSCCICESLPQIIRFIHSTLRYSRLSSCIQCQFYNKAIEIEKSSSKRQIWNRGRNIRAHRAKWGKKKRQLL